MTTFEEKLRDLKAKLHDGLKARDQLAAVTDELTAELQAIETGVAQLKLGVSASVELNGEGQYRSHLPTRLLHFKKCGDKWRFAVTYLGGGGEVLLVNASRRLRLEAVEVLPELITLLMTNAATEQEVVNKKLTILRDLHGVLQTPVGSWPVPPPDMRDDFVADMAVEARDGYINNLRVRYEGLLELAQKSNDDLALSLKDSRDTYDRLMDILDEMFTGSGGDNRSLNLEAVAKLRDVLAASYENYP